MMMSDRQPRKWKAVERDLFVRVTYDMIVDAESFDHITEKEAVDEHNQVIDEIERLVAEREQLSKLASNTCLLCDKDHDDDIECESDCCQIAEMWNILEPEEQSMQDDEIADVK